MHSNLFLSLNAAQIYCPLYRDLGAIHSSSATETLCVSPQTENPFLSLTHTDHHSYLIRGGGRWRKGSTHYRCCCWSAPSKQEDLLGLITLASPLQLPTNNNSEWPAFCRQNRALVCFWLLVWVYFPPNNLNPCSKKVHWLRSADASLDLRGCVSSVCLHSAFIFPSITDMR